MVQCVAVFLKCVAVAKPHGVTFPVVSFCELTTNYMDLLRDAVCCRCSVLQCAAADMVYLAGLYLPSRQLQGSFAEIDLQG